ncbi:MAG: hypothetical protein ACRD0P_32680, partial [Stackebrandtia sp.]
CRPTATSVADHGGRRAIRANVGADHANAPTFSTYGRVANRFMSTLSNSHRAFNDKLDSPLLTPAKNCRS